MCELKYTLIILTLKYSNKQQQHPPRIVEKSSYVSASVFLLKRFNESFFKKRVFSKLELADITSVYVKNDSLDKPNYGPVSTSTYVSASVLFKRFNESVKKREFPQNLKLADIGSLYQKNKPSNKINQRLVSALPLLLKIFEKR